MVRPEALATTLVARCLAAHASERERRERARAHVEAGLRRLRAEKRIGRAWLIGSVLGTAFGDCSDVDVVVEGADPRDLPALADALAEGCSAPIDLLSLETLDGSFRDRVLREGVAVHGT